MVNNNRGQTLSQALLNLARIRSVEEPVTNGLFGLYKAMPYNEAQRPGTEDIKHHLLRIKEFLDSFENIVNLDREESSEVQDKLKVDELKEKIMGLHLRTHLSIYSLIPRKERLEWWPQLESVKNTIDDVLAGKASNSTIFNSVKILEDFKKTINSNFETEKRISEKIIGGRIAV